MNFDKNKLVALVLSHPDSKEPGFCERQCPFYSACLLDQWAHAASNDAGSCEDFLTRYLNEKG